MGWKAAAILVEHRTPDDVVAEVDVYRPSDRTVDLVGAWDELAVAQIGETAVFFTGRRRQAELAAALSNGTRAFAFFLDSVHTTYGFDYFVDGACVRSVERVERELTRDEGAPLDAERTTPVPSWGHDDDWVLAVMAQVIGVDAQQLDAAAYTVLEP
jgi:hypothetical protein